MAKRSNSTISNLKSIGLLFNDEKRSVINFHFYDVYLSGCLVFEPVPYLHHSAVSFLDLLENYNGLRPKISRLNLEPVLPFFRDQRGLA